MGLASDIFLIGLKTAGLLILGIVALFFLVIAFGDEIFWNFQLTSSCDAFKNDKVRIKIKCTKRKGQRIEIRQPLKPDYHHKAVSFILNGKEISTLSANQNTESNDPIVIPIEIDKPKKGQILLVKIDNQDILSGRITSK